MNNADNGDVLTSAQFEPEFISDHACINTTEKYHKKEKITAHVYIVAMLI